jgi:hypothetical protein
LEREAISGPSIDYSSFSKALFGSNVEGQQFLSTMKALPLSKCPVNSKKGNFDQLPASYKSWDKLDEKQLGTQRAKTHFFSGCFSAAGKI